MTSLAREPREAFPNGPDGKARSGQQLPDERDLYDSGTAESMRSTPDPGSSFHGEFEQRVPGQRGTGPAGYVVSDEELRRELCRRVAEDPRLAGEPIEITVKEQSVVFAGSVRHGHQREWLVQHAEAIGIADVRENLLVGEKSWTAAPS